MPSSDPAEISSSDRQAARERAFRLLLGTLLALFLTFTALAGVFLWYDHAARWVLHTQQVRRGIGDVLQNLTDAETAQRGYLLTSDPQFLAQIEAGRRSAQANVAAVAAMTRDNPEQGRRLATLRAAMRTRMAVIDQTVVLRRQGDVAAALRIIQGGQGVAAMARVRALLADLYAAEAHLEADREARAGAVRFVAVCSLAVFGLLLAGLFVKATRDVTLDRDIEAERVERLRELVQERTLLLDEVNHRVKNSLQQIASVVRLQARALHPGEARDALDKTLARIMAVGRVHEQLYKTETGVGMFDAGAYAEALARELVESLARDDVQLVTEVEHAQLDMRQASPLALILNELITNALKYGCPPDRPCRIHVGFRTVGDLYRLTVSDEGEGLPRAFSSRSKSSLGMRAIEALTRQLGGRLMVEPSPIGASFAVVFPKSVS